MITKEQIKAIWDSLQNDPLSKMRQCCEGLPIFAGVNDRTITILFMTDKETPIGIKPKHYTNVSIDIQSLSQTKKGLVVSMFKPNFYELFSVMAVDIINSVEKEQNESRHLLCFIQKLNEWRLMFSKQVHDLLSDEEQLGLYGELYLLRNLLQEGVDAAKLLECWTGPEGEDKDYKFDNIAVEVKTSTNTEHKCAISNLLQLDETNYRTLFLYCFIFTRSKAGADTLPAIISTIRDILDSITVTDSFNMKLLKIGYNDEDALSYTTSYSLFDESYFDIKGRFPRITESTTNKGIIKANYTIDLNVCEEYTVSYNDIINQIKKII